MTIGLRIKQAREAAKINQTQLSTLIGTTPQSVQLWESGKTIPRYKKISQLADVLNVSADWLLTGLGNSTDPSPAQNDDSELSQQEKIMIELFRGLTDEQKTTAVQTLEAQKQQNKIIWEQLSKVMGKK